MFEYYFSPDKKTTVCIFKASKGGDDNPRMEARRLIKHACTYSNGTGWDGVTHFIDNTNSTELFFNKLLDAIIEKMPKTITAKTTLRGNDIYDEEEGKRIAKAKCLNKFYSKLDKICRKESGTFIHEFYVARSRMDEVINAGINRNRNKILNALENKF